MLIGSHKNKFIFRSQNLSIFFKNVRKRKFSEFPEFWGNFRKFILQSKEFSSHTKVYTRNFFYILSFAKVVHAVNQCFYKYNKILRKMKLLYSQKSIWQNLFLWGVHENTSTQILKILLFSELVKVSPNKVIGMHIFQLNEVF